MAKHKKTPNEETERTGTVELTVRICDGETGEFLECNDYTLENVSEDIAKEVDAGDFDRIFPLLFEAYPWDFPDEEPGVDAEIDGWEVDWDSFK